MDINLKNHFKYNCSLCPEGHDIHKTYNKPLMYKDSHFYCD